jgi:N-acetylglucosamine kinase-like BadF-type ATPase
MDLSKKALRAVYRAELGIDAPTGLTSAVLDFFGLEQVEAVLHRVTARGEEGEGSYAMLASTL